MLGRESEVSINKPEAFKPDKSQRWQKWIVRGGIALVAVALSLHVSPETQNNQEITIIKPDNVYFAALSRSDSIGGFVYGHREEIFQCSGADSFEIRNKESFVPGQGFHEVSGGLFGRLEEPIANWLYINTNKQNGLYEGTQTVRCLAHNQDGRSNVLSETEVGYRINLLD